MFLGLAEAGMIIHILAYDNYRPEELMQYDLGKLKASRENDETIISILNANSIPWPGIYSTESFFLHV